MLGPVELLADGARIALPAGKLRCLLAALVVRTGSARSVDSLIDALWGSRPPASAEKLVQVYVSQLRKVLPGGVSISTRGRAYAIDPDGWQLDAQRFEQLVDEGRSARAQNPHLASSLLRRGLSMWRGDAYGEFAAAAFARAEAERLTDLRRRAAEERNDLELQLGRHAQILPELRATAAADPLGETSQAQLMLALYRSGQQSAAIELYHKTRSRLVEELGVEPGPALRQLFGQILRHDPSLQPAQQGTNGASRESQSNLPAPPTRVHGRAAELARLHELVHDPEARLIVLTGAGGSGKTRLAIEVARREAYGFANGAAFASLAAVSDPSALADAVAAALDLQQVPTRPFDSLVEHLRDREMLLVLDNLEQLRTAAAMLVSLLACAPRLKILVTSRVVLHVSGEHVFPVDPLPDDAAVTLFTERGRTANPRLTADDFDQATVDELCRRLDRLPLAIELAASHVRVLMPVELLARLKRRLPLVVDAPTDLPSRQRTLRATLQWSFDRLQPEARTDLAQLSVFADGCSLAGAAALLGTGESTPRRLLELVDNSLLAHTSSAYGSRYHMLETVREFAAEQLAAVGGADAAQRRHAEYMIGYAKSLGLSIDALASGAPKAHHRAVVEQSNLRAALDWAEHADPILGLELMAQLEQFWIASNPREGVSRLDLLLDRAPHASPHIRARALRDLGGAVEFVGDLRRAAGCYRASLALYKRLGDTSGELRLLHRCAQLALYANDLDAARSLINDGLQRSVTAGLRYEEAEFRRAAGSLELACGNLEDARSEEETALRLIREIGAWPWGECTALRVLGEICSADGRHHEAVAYQREALSLILPLGDRIKIVRGAAALALCSLRAGDDETAGRLWGSIEAEEQRSFLGFWTYAREQYARDLDSCTSDVFLRGRTAGRGCPLDESIQPHLLPSA